MNVLVPCLRLLVAAALMVLFPLVVAFGGASPLWLALPLPLLTVAGAVLQDYRRPAVIAACAASNASFLVVIYLGGLAVFQLIGTS